MKPRSVGTTMLLVAGVAVAATLGTIILIRVLTGALSAAGVDPVAAASIRTTLYIVAVLLAAAAVVTAVVAGKSLRRALVATRAAVLARAHGDATAPLPHTGLAELDDVSRAVDRLSTRLGQRDADLDRERQQLAVLLDSVSEGILQVDTAGRLVRANPAARALLGLSDQPQGQPLSTRVRNAELRRLVDEAVSGRRVPATEIVVDDHRVLVSARAVPADGTTSAGAVLAFVDLTELRRLEGVRRDFVANVSHELKTPLTSIRGYVETLLADEELPADVRRQFLEVVHKNADRLHHIVDDLLDLSRLQSGGWRPEFHEVNALAVIDDVWSSCSDTAEKRRIAFVPPREPVTVLADPGGLRQVLANLFDNALRYTPSGGRIEVATLAPLEHTGNGNGDTAFVTFEVRDNGSGIPSDALPRIFERFYRVDPARSRAEGGTGLGLSIVKHLVESMGGDVGAESELGKGTVVRFRLPAAT